MLALNCCVACRRTGKGTSVFSLRGATGCGRAVFSGWTRRGVGSVMASDSAIRGRNARATADPVPPQL